MVRPRASVDNLRVAIAFAGIITRQANQSIFQGCSKMQVERKGGRSIFAAFAELFPDIVRQSSEKRPKNRRGVALAEFNKALQSIGFTPLRRRERINGSVQWGSKV